MVNLSESINEMETNIKTKNDAIKCILMILLIKISIKSVKLIDRVQIVYETRVNMTKLFIYDENDKELS